MWMDDDPNPTDDDGRPMVRRCGKCGDVLTDDHRCRKSDD